MPAIRSNNNFRRTLAQLRAQKEELEIGLNLNVEVERGIALIGGGTDPSEHIYIVTTLVDLAKEACVCLEHAPKPFHCHRAAGPTRTKEQCSGYRDNSEKRWHPFERR